MYSLFAAAFLAFTFIPLPIPIALSHAPERVAPPTNLQAVVDPLSCTADVLGSDVTPAACSELVSSHRGFVAHFDWAQTPCGTKHCAAATNFEVARNRAPMHDLIASANASPPSPVPSLRGRHAFAVEYASDEPVCIDVRSVAVVVDPKAPTKTLTSNAANVCVYKNAADMPKKR